MNLTYGFRGSFRLSVKDLELGVLPFCCRALDLSCVAAVWHPCFLRMLVEAEAATSNSNLNLLGVRVAVSPESRAFWCMMCSCSVAAQTGTIAPVTAERCLRRCHYSVRAFSESNETCCSEVWSARHISRHPAYYIILSAYFTSRLLLIATSRTDVSAEL